MVFPTSTALTRTTDPADRFNRLMTGLLDAGRHADMDVAIGREIARNPLSATAQHWKGVVLLLGNRHEEALRVFQELLSAGGSDAVVFDNIGFALNRLQRFSAAAAAYEKSLALAPQRVDTLINAARNYLDAWQAEEAGFCLQRALMIAPGDRRVMHARASLQTAVGDHLAADQGYRQLIDGGFQSAEVLSDHLLTLNYLPESDAPLLKCTAQRYAEKWPRCKQSPTFIPRTGDTLRVGFVSADLRDHPVAYFLDAAMACADHRRISWFAYSASPFHDSFSERLKKHFDGWRDISGCPDEVTAGKIRADGIDLLIDLSGHTGHNRLPLFALRPAPVQASWLGYIGTSGLPEIDFLLTDEHFLPSGAESECTETPYRLPGLSLCFRPESFGMADLPVASANTGRFTFGCFNNTSKLNDDVIECWSSILRACPESRLLLKTRQLSDAATADRIRQRFVAHGVGNDRLQIEPGAPSRPDLLREYARVDVALDPFPYPGVTTTLEALWMGVPVLSLKGQRMLSRAGEAILRTVGLQPWLADSRDNYVCKAVAAAENRQDLTDLKSNLRNLVRHSAITDAPGFARHFEMACHRMAANRNEPKTNPKPTLRSD